MAEMKTIIGIASIPTREESLKQVLASIMPQVDYAYVAFNGYDRIPQFVNDYYNLKPFLTLNENGDAEKFRFVSEVNGYYLSCDDDLIYPPTYVQDMVRAIERYHCIVTLHGKVYDDLPVVSFRRSITTVVRCLGTLAMDRQVQVPGTGVMAFSTADFKISVDDFEHANMADVIVAREAYKQGVKIMALAHRNDYLKYIPQPRGTTIWEMGQGKDQIQTDILNSFLK